MQFGPIWSFFTDFENFEKKLISRFSKVKPYKSAIFDIRSLFTDFFQNYEKNLIFRFYRVKPYKSAILAN